VPGGACALRGDDAIALVSNPSKRTAATAMSDPSRESGDPRDGLALEESRPEVKKPPLYKVVLLNDDYTPMEFVVDVLKKFFGMEHDKATQVMLNVHTRGRGVAGVYTFEIAETKVILVNDYAREHEHPLQCTLEES
jgi:ATP-dependent Clp protease adaptor protein ClpS